MWLYDYVIAKYIRLSSDDVYSDSLSIPNQHLILNEHIEELNIPNVTVLDFVDNGHTGTNMERPALQEMLELARCGKINCILVKDFSRFSRNALESGYYIEQVFPLYRVRFISVSERFDSDDYKDSTGGIDVAFKFLMNEYYSLDLSKKIKSARRIQMARGESKSGTPIYGYCKDEAGKLVLDEYAANVVSGIYDMALTGMPPAIIKNRLFEANHPTPKEHEKITRSKDITPRCLWGAEAVRRILTNEQYTGMYISGKIEHNGFGDGKPVYADESNWIRIPNNHPAIISGDVFEKVQVILKNHLNKRKSMIPLNNNSEERGIDSPSLCQAGAPIYGYIKTDNGTLKIDSQAADVVRKIFNLFIQGLHLTEISERLFDSGCPTPREYIKHSKGRCIEPTCKWTVKSVRNILRNVQYTGAFVSGKIPKDGDTGKRYYASKDDWCFVPEVNPSIIGKDIFDKAQKILTAYNEISRKNKQPREYLLRGKVKCGCCDTSMSYISNKEPAFYCYKTAANPHAPCHKMKVLAKELDDAVLDIIKKQAEVVLATVELNSIKKTGGNLQPVVEYEKQSKILVEQNQALYEQYITQVIDKETFMSLKNSCTEQLNALNNQLTINKQMQHNSQAYKKIASQAKAVMDKNISQRELVDMLIDKIHVSPGCHIEISWKIAGFGSSTVS